ncbi:MAG TPA: histidine kinase [Balneolaceae bacterium]|nr:histidine kinase [Balneolaceae bacterium]
MNRILALYHKTKTTRLFIALGIVCWLFLFMTTVSRTYAYYLHENMEMDLAFILMRALLIWGIPLFFIPIFIKLARKFPIDGALSYRNGFIHFGMSLAFVPIHAALYRTIMLIRYFLLHPKEIQLGWAYFFEPFMTIMTWLVIIGPLGYWLTVGAWHFKMYYDQFRERQLRNTRLESELSSIRLQVLKIQLHPHFLFNTLHNINSLMYEDANKAKQMLSLLKQFLQISLTKMDRQLLPLSDELEFTEIYLQIIQTRFSDRLTIKRAIERDTLSVRVPGLVLQPLVENAVRHGISKKIRPGIIKIISRRNGDMYQLIVEDNGPGLPEKHEHGVGLNNIRQRLEQLYTHYRFDLERSELGGLKVVIEIPYQSEQDPIPIEQ